MYVYIYIYYVLFAILIISHNLGTYHNHKPYPKQSSKVFMELVSLFLGQHDHEVCCGSRGRFNDTEGGCSVLLRESLRTISWKGCSQNIDKLL